MKGGIAKTSFSALFPLFESCRFFCCCKFLEILRSSSASHLLFFFRHCCFCLTEIKFEKGEKYGIIEEWERNSYGSILKRRSTQATMGTITG